MSQNQTPAFGKAGIYNDKGQTVVPQDIRERMGAGVGDTLKWVHEDGKTVVYLAEDE